MLWLLIYGFMTVNLFYVYNFMPSLSECIIEGIMFQAVHPLCSSVHLCICLFVQTHLVTTMFNEWLS